MENASTPSIYEAILRQLRRLLTRTSGSLTSAGSRLFKPQPSPQQAGAIAWFRDQGDKTLRVEYDLDDSSIVFDLGGYEGQWSSDIFGRYCCSIHVFEPVESFASTIEGRFSRNERIVLHRFGLSDRTFRTQIYLDKDATSIFGSTIFGSTTESEEISLVRASDFLEESGIAKIDLVKINIEGGEYDLLEHLLDCGIAARIMNIQVQFHSFVPDAERRMARIQQRLKETHYLTYQYLFVWENWTIK